MKQGKFEIISNRLLAEGVYEMKLTGDCSAITSPGQFVNIKLDGLFLRRPISVCNLEGDVLTIIYKCVGIGTKQMACMRPGQELDVLTGLGNGYDTCASGMQPLLLGGGAGVPPLYWLARELIAEGKAVTVVLGFNTRDEIFYADEFEALGARVILTTVDGSAGIKGFVTDAMKGLTFSYTYACGPEAMLRAVYQASAKPGQFSFEERMGCGFGACMGCSCKTKYGNKRICKDGPVLEREEIVW